ncbi:MAG: hypothetical protein WCR85_00300 [Sphaerochaeta sp.]
MRTSSEGGSASPSSFVDANGDALFDANGMPIFDKSRLLSEEFKSYLYTLDFQKKPVTDMGVGGYMKAIRPYQAGGYTVEHLATHVMGATIYCQVRVRITLLSGRVFESFGDADNRGTPDGDTCLRTAESVAFKRAVGRALNISQVDFGNEASAPKRRHENLQDPASAKTEVRGIDLSKAKPHTRAGRGAESKPAQEKQSGGLWDRCR